MTRNQHQPCPQCRSAIIYRSDGKWRNLADDSLHTCPTMPEPNDMAKNTEERGETKSAPKEIAKMATNTCVDCGLPAVAPIVVPAADGLTARCSNAIACSKRKRRSERIAADRARAAGSE